MLDFDDFVQVYLAEDSQYKYNQDTYAISIETNKETWVAFLDKSTKPWYKMTKKVLTEKDLTPIFKGVLKSKSKGFDSLFYKALWRMFLRIKLRRFLLTG